MSKMKLDSFHAYLVKGANFDGKWEIPRIETSVNTVPQNLVLFSKIRKATAFDQWVAFFTDDYRFERMWNNPSAYVESLQRFEGIISPDFSVYRDMPLVMQAWNVYRNHALAYWFSTKGISVIPNVRWGDERSYEFCFDGLPRDGIVAIGTHGCLRDRTSREDFERGLVEMTQRLTPRVILVYGPTPKDMFAPYQDSGIQIVQYESERQSFFGGQNKRGVA